MDKDKPWAVHYYQAGVSPGVVEYCSTKAEALQLAVDWMKHWRTFYAGTGYQREGNLKLEGYGRYTDRCGHTDSAVSIRKDKEKARP